MARTLNEVIKGLPFDQQQEIEAQAERLIEEEMTLRDLRKAHELTQERMAETLRISQDGVSRIEKRSDFLLSTLRSYVEAMGGKLRLIAEFPDRKPVTLSDLKSLDTHARRDRKTTSSRSSGKRDGRPKKKPDSADVA
ncbi:MAG: XRE family transcriptional regulator [Deltaproteobacteria bacterium]|nr:XRE family transcriptional regulator [Deltaproteobacteria bacterium]